MLLHGTKRNIYLTAPVITDNLQEYSKLLKSPTFVRINLECLTMLNKISYNKNKVYFFLIFNYFTITFYIYYLRKSVHLEILIYLNNATILQQYLRGSPRKKKTGYLLSLVKFVSPPTLPSTFWTHKLWTF